MKVNLRKIFHKNPLYYLGFLGFVGIIGLCFSSPILSSFLLCFTFFAYGDMIADEMFWENVRRAGFRAFLSGFAFGILSQAVMVPRAMYYGFRELQFTDGFAQISEQFYLQALFGSAAFVLSFILMLVVFTGSLLIFRHREKQGLRESEE